MSSFRDRLLSLVSYKKFHNFSAEDYDHVKLGFSQCGEDLAFLDLCEDRNGFYVSIGCFHPVRCSHTYFLHKNMGWSGINVDTNKDVIELFDQYRPGDVNLAVGVSDEIEELDYYNFFKRRFNSLSRQRAGLLEAHIKSMNSDKLLEVEKGPVLPLREILKTYMKLDQEINLMTVDCEGLDLKVLQSNDWEKYRPNILMIKDSKEEMETPLTEYCKWQGYKFFNWVGPTKFFRDIR